MSIVWLGTGPYLQLLASNCLALLTFPCSFFSSSDSTAFWGRRQFRGLRATKRVFTARHLQRKCRIFAVVICCHGNANVRTDNYGERKAIQLGPKIERYRRAPALFRTQNRRRPMKNFGLDFYWIFISTKNHSRGGQRLQLLKIKVFARQKGTC